MEAVLFCYHALSVRARTGFLLEIADLNLLFISLARLIYERMISTSSSSRPIASLKYIIQENEHKQNKVVKITVAAVSKHKSSHIESASIIVMIIFLYHPFLWLCLYYIRTSVPFNVLVLSVNNFF